LQNLLIGYANMHDTNWSDLQTFLQVQARGSVSAAARALGVNHSTVLRRLDSLEQALALRLFERLPSGYVATAAGEQLAAQLAGVQEQVESATRRLAGSDLEIAGTIRLTSTDTLFRSVLMPGLREFQGLHPRLQLQLVMNNSFMSLSKREADIAVRGSLHPPEHLVGRRAGSIQTAPYAARAYLENHAQPARWQDHRWIGPDESLAHLEQAKWLAANIDDARVAVRIDSLAGMLDCALQGMGAAMLLCPLADQHPGLVRLAEPLPELDTPVWILTHPDLKKLARIKALTTFLYHYLGASLQQARH
jgi:DNA-binding transcriptional LysR family regulator